MATTNAAQNVKTSTIAIAGLGVIATGIIAYAVYFDHKRRTDPEFRKNLKRESRKLEKAAKQEAEAQGKRQREAIKEAIDSANEEGFPKDPEEVESFFMQEVAHGEALCQDGGPIEAALCFYKALKVYPQPKELVSIYDKTVPKPILDILAQMIAVDPKMSISTKSTGEVDD